MVVAVVSVDREALRSRSTARDPGPNPCGLMRVCKAWSAARVHVTVSMSAGPLFAEGAVVATEALADLADLAGVTCADAIC